MFLLQLLFLLCFSRKPQAYLRILLGKSQCSALRAFPVKTSAGPSLLYLISVMFLAKSLTPIVFVETSVPV